MLPDAKAQAWSNDKTTLADALATAVMASKPDIPSVAMGVSINGGSVLVTGHGLANIQTGQKADGDTVYRIGSLSKQMTAAVVLSLLDESPLATAPGTIRQTGFTLDTSLGRVVPQATAWMPSGPVKLRHLLNMQSGFVSYTKLNLSMREVPDRTAAIAVPAMRAFIDTLLQATPPSLSPGTGYDYSNTNYWLLADVAETIARARGQQPAWATPSFSGLLQARVFKPAGMSASRSVGDGPGALDAVPPYDMSKAPFSRYAWPRGAGEIKSTARDMLRWHAALMSGRILTPAQREQMFKPVAPAGQVNGFPLKYGMGWTVLQVGDFDWYAHGGSIEGFSAYDGILLNRATGVWVSAVILTNQFQVKLDRATECLAQLAMDVAVTAKDIGPAAQQTCSQL